MDQERTLSKIFTPGPTPISKHILEIGAQQPPYNRTQNFSKLTNEIIDNLKYIFQTTGDVVLLTASGTGAMEATVLGFLREDDKALIINGGTFGKRWVDLCKIHNIPFEEVTLDFGKSISIDLIEDFLSKSSYTTLLMNAHETSTGLLHDVEQIGKITREQGIFFIVDAISSIGADTFLMDDWCVDVAILSSQKALALPPGLSFVALNSQAKDRLHFNDQKSLYFNLLDYLEDQKRGQVPFSPAISLFLMLHQRLEDIRKIGLDNLISQHEELAKSFRSQIYNLPFEIFPEHNSNAMTALSCDNEIDASEVVRILEKTHGVFVAPNGGDLKSLIFRISHMGDQSLDDVVNLVRCLRETVFSLKTFSNKGVLI